MSARSSELDIEKDGVVKVESDKVYGQDGGAAADQLSQNGVKRCVGQLCTSRLCAVDTDGLVSPDAGNSRRGICR